MGIGGCNNVLYEWAGYFGVIYAAIGCTDVLY